MERIQYFGVWIKKSEKNKISRENYATIEKKNSMWSSKTKSYYKTVEERQKLYDDAECRIYSDSFCKEWQEKCLINFDKNIEFFKQLSRDAFEDDLQKLINFNENVKQILDLNECKGMRGLYILVLDEYKQVYIGQARDIKRRILSHWSRKKEFDRLLFGGVNSSVISIDCFGALDSTRIFVLETDDLDSSESLAISKISKMFSLNRIGGGTIYNNFDLIIALGERNLRQLKDCHSEEYAEKYEKEVDVTYFVAREYCEVQELVAGDIICIEETQKETAFSIKSYGKVLKTSKTTLRILQLYESSLENSFISEKLDEKRLGLNIRDFRIKKSMRFLKVNVVEQKEKRTFWRSKKIPYLEA